MSQNAPGPIDPKTTTGTKLAEILNNWNDSILTSHWGGIRPAYAKAGTLWVNASASPACVLNLYDGTQDIPILAFDSNTHTGSGGSGAINSLFTTPPVPWDVAAAYPAGTVVTNAGGTFVAKDAVPAGTVPAVGPHWDVIDLGKMAQDIALLHASAGTDMQYRGDFIPGGTYVVGDLVRTMDAMWVCIANPTDPNAQPAAPSWEKFSGGSTGTGGSVSISTEPYNVTELDAGGKILTKGLPLEGSDPVAVNWEATKHYYTGSIVKYQGAYYHVWGTTPIGSIPTDPVPPANQNDYYWEEVGLEAIAMWAYDMQYRGEILPLMWWEGPFTANTAVVTLHNGSMTIWKSTADTTAADIPGVSPLWVEKGTTIEQWLKNEIGWSARDLDSLSDVDLASNPPANGNVLQFNGSNWVADVLALTLDGLQDVNATAPNLNEVLRFDGTSWVPHPNTLASLGDVDTAQTGVAAGDLLQSDGTVWKPIRGLALDDLTDVDVSATDVDHVLTRRSDGIWVSAPPSILGITQAAYDALSTKDPKVLYCITG